MAPTLVFMGTPDFSVPSLRALHQAGFDIRLVVTQPDKPKGRGRTLEPSPVKRCAASLNYPILQPDKIRNTEFIVKLGAMEPDFLVVVAFGQILSGPILQIPQKGAVNVHASLLPKYRGPAPIQWAILRGESVTGVTTMLMDTGVDTGDILLSATTPIQSDDTAATVHDRLAELGAGILVRTLDQVWSGSLFPRAQNNNEATYAPMLNKESGRIQWNLSSDYLQRLIRAMTPRPGAYCLMGKRRLKIFSAEAVSKSHEAEPGTVLAGFPDELRIATGAGILSPKEVQIESGKRLPVQKFLRGHPIAPGTRLG